MRAKDLTGRLARWVMRLHPYDFELVYHPGSSNLVADALSRTPGFEEGSAVVSALIRDVVAPGLDELRRAQRDDEVLAWVYRVLKDSAPLPRGKLGRSVSSMLRGSEIREGLVGRLIHDEGGDRFVIIVPSTLRNCMITVFHNSAVGGHLGAVKTVRRIQQSYTWYGMTKDVTSFVRKCHKCQVFKTENQLPKGLMGSRNQLVQPWDNLCIDLTGPFPRSRAGNTHLLVISDQLTKWVELFPMRKATAVGVAKILVGEVFPRFGTPKVILSDNGRQFVSRVVKWICRLFGVKQVFTSLYHPQPNQAERVIKTVKSMIAKTIRSDHRSWDVDLPFVAMGIRTALSEGTRYTPAFLMFGRELRIPGDVTVDPEMKIDKGSEEMWAVAVAKRTRNAICRAQRALQVKEGQNKTRYDEGRRDISFRVGDMVLRRAHPQSSAVKGFMAKLAPKWEGPFRVHSVCSPLTYVLQDQVAGGVLSGTVHVVDLAKYFGGAPDVRVGGQDEGRQGTSGATSAMVWGSVDPEGEPVRRTLRPRGATQQVMRQAIVDLLQGTRRSGDTSSREGGVL